MKSKFDVLSTYIVVDRDTIDPQKLWDLNWVNFPFDGIQSIYPTTHAIYNGPQYKKQCLNVDTEPWYRTQTSF